MASGDLGLKPGNGADPGLVEAAENMLAQELVRTDRFVLAERRAIKKALSEQSLQRSGLTESSAMRIGQMLAASKILIGGLSRSGGAYILSVRIVDVETGRVDIAASETFLKATEMQAAAAAISRKMVGRPDA